MRDSKRTTRVVLTTALVVVSTVIDVLPADESPSLAKRLLLQSNIRSGLCVHVGRPDAKLLAALAQEHRLLVQSLSVDAAATASARAELAEHGIYGQASIEDFGQRKRLPYADNTVSLLLIDDITDLLERGLSLAEMVRVVCPHGVLLFRLANPNANSEVMTARLKQAGIEFMTIVDADGPWLKAVKPRSEKMDDWTHRNHRPDGNRVSQDLLVEVPSGLRWLAPPKWSDKPIANMLSAGGRLYFVMASHLSDVQHMAAVDAYNGLLLWERQWKRQLQINVRRSWSWPMAATDERLYLALENQFVAVNGATGETEQRFDTTGSVLTAADRIAVIDRTLILATSDCIRVFKTDDGTLNWSYQGQPVDTVVTDSNVYFLDFQTDNKAAADSKDDKQPPVSVLVGLELSTGREVWRRSLQEFQSAAVDRRGNRSQKHPVQLCFHQNGHLVLAGDAKKQQSIIVSISAKDGHVESKYQTNRIRADHVVFRKNLICVPGSITVDPTTKRLTPPMEVDPKTGRVVRTLRGRFNSSTCQLPVFTNRFAFAPKLAMTAVDLETGRTQSSPLATGGCRVGMIPANGVLYNALQSGCLCNSAAVRGLAALQSTRLPETKTPAAERLEHGPAKARPFDSNQGPRPDDWPTYRHNPQRSGRTSSTGPRQLKQIWITNVSQQRSTLVQPSWAKQGNIPNERITAPVIANGRVFVAETDAHRVIALDATTGKHLWHFTAGGRIDSPPTIHANRCLFGCYDGWLYCLDTTDGKLVWRFRLAPDDQRIVAFNQLESPWPSFGSVLVKAGTVYATAGRSSAAAGGLRVFALNPQTGQLIWEQPVKQTGLLNDILVADNDFIYLRTLQFDPKTGKQRQVVRAHQLRAPGEVRVPFKMERGLDRPKYLHSSWLHALHDGSWRYAFRSYHKGNQRRSYGDVFGQLIVFNNTHTYGFRTGYWSGQKDTPAHLFRQKQKSPAATNQFLRTAPIQSQRQDPAATKPKADWAVDMSAESWVEAMVLASGTLFVAGPTDHAGRSKSTGFLQSLSTRDGSTRQKLNLSTPPRLDALAVASGQLYVATSDGHVLCFGEN